MKIALVVPGRFHAFDLGRALIARGHQVTVLTNYPRWAVTRFGLPRDCARSFPLHGIASRGFSAARPAAVGRWWEPIGHRSFGRWAVRVLSNEAFDVIHCWSGVSEEILASGAAGDALTLLMRGSSHIATQRTLLDEESRRVNAPLDRPSDWMVARELREYARVDQISVLSTFARRSFEEQGVASRRVSVLPLGADVQAFKPPRTVIDERLRRIRGGAPLRVLYVGALSYRKGFFDLARAIEMTPQCRFTLAGPLTPETRAQVAALGSRVRVLGKLPQARLPAVYWSADLFVFPTIEDGFALVLAQARAAGLPILTTPNSAGPDLLADGRDGWIVPIRDPDAIAGRLAWCDDNRAAIEDATIRGAAAVVRDWPDVAADFERACETAWALRGVEPVTHAS